jgi:CubicO group peptidase (beta-lactamase class C family)
VHGVLIVHRGRLAFEEYFYEYDAKTPHALRSATKSVVSALVGLAIAKGHLP